MPDNELRRLSKQLEATLTPRQRQLLLLGRPISDEMMQWTDYQKELNRQMAPFLEGLSFEEGRQLGAQDVFDEGYERGREAGRRLVWMIGVIFLLIVFSILVAHC
jgi:hypothetical protein